jgi:hypothetical protein
MQFSLRWLFIATTLAVLYAALLFAFPIGIGLAGVVGLSAVILGFAVGGACYGKADQRAFWIGCLVTSIPCPFIAAFTLYFLMYALFFEASFDDDDIPVSMWTLAACHLLSFVGGGLCVLSRRLHAGEDDR